LAKKNKCNEFEEGSCQIRSLLWSSLLPTPKSSSTTYLAFKKEMKTNVARQLNQFSAIHSHSCELLQIHRGQQNNWSRNRAQSTCAHRRNHITVNDSSVNAFTHISQLPLPSTKGPLSGLSVAIKDNIATSFLPTTCSSAMLKGMQYSIAIFNVCKR